MATEKWIAGSGQGLTWGIAFTAASTLNNSIPTGNSIASDLSLTNASALDIFCDLSISLNTITPIAPNYVGVYLLPLNQDGTTYGDNKIANSSTGTAGTPGSTYAVGTINVTTSAAVQVGTLSRIILPPGGFRFCLYNNTGVTWSASANVCQYRTYNRSIA